MSSHTSPHLSNGYWAQQNYTEPSSACSAYPLRPLQGEQQKPPPREKITPFRQFKWRTSTATGLEIGKMGIQKAIFGLIFGLFQYNCPGGEVLDGEACRCRQSRNLRRRLVSLRRALSFIKPRLSPVLLLTRFVFYMRSYCLYLVF